MQLLVMLVLTCVLTGLTASLWRRVTYASETVAYCYRHEQMQAVLEGALSYGVHQLSIDSALQKRVMTQKTHDVEQVLWEPFRVHCQYALVSPDVMTLTITVLQQSSIQLQRAFIFDVVRDGNKIRQVRGRGEFFGVY